MIALPEALKKLIAEEGENAFPNECCGVIFGDYGDVKTAAAAQPVINNFDDGEKYHRFLITPEDIMKAELKAREIKLDILGFYHSHPDSPAKPSEYDREHALPFYSYIIVSVIGGKAADFTSWELSEDRKNFNQEEIKWQ